MQRTIRVGYSTDKSGSDKLLKSTTSDVPRLTHQTMHFIRLASCFLVAFILRYLFPIPSLDLFRIKLGSLNSDVLELFSD